MVSLQPVTGERVVPLEWSFANSHAQQAKSDQLVCVSLRGTSKRMQRPYRAQRRPPIGGNWGFRRCFWRIEAGRPHAHRRNPHPHDASGVGWLASESRCSLASMETTETLRVKLASKARFEAKGNVRMATIHSVRPHAFAACGRTCRSSNPVRKPLSFCFSGPPPGPTLRFLDFLLQPPMQSRRRSGRPTAPGISQLAKPRVTRTTVVMNIYVRPLASSQCNLATSPSISWRDRGSF